MLVSSSKVHSDEFVIMLQRPSGWWHVASGGQTVVEPSQDSAGSQAPADERQTVLLPCTPSCGQALLLPSQDSATSQAPAEERHTAVRLPSAGQAALVPVQFSARSQA